MDSESMANRLLDAFITPWANRESNSLAARFVDAEAIDHKPLLPSIGQVKTMLKRLNPKKATGVDGIPAWILKSFHICASILQCKYPSLYKHVLISPDPKVNDRMDLVTDFRQISVIPKGPKSWRRYNYC
jgi:hypothetical protein